MRLHFVVGCRRSLKDALVQHYWVGHKVMDPDETSQCGVQVTCPAAVSNMLVVDGQTVVEA